MTKYDIIDRQDDGRLQPQSFSRIAEGSTDDATVLEKSVGQGGSVSRRFVFGHSQTLL
jgi:hypothetical protein